MVDPHIWVSSHPSHVSREVVMMTNNVNTIDVFGMEQVMVHMPNQIVFHIRRMFNLSLRTFRGDGVQVGPTIQHPRVALLKQT